MDLVIYEKKTNKIIMIFENAMLKADNCMSLCNHYGLKYVDGEYMKTEPDGTPVLIDEPKREKAKIIYLDDYRKPY